MADINVTVPSSTFSITKPVSDFTVTTPTQQVIQVGDPASTIDITNNPIDITVLTNGSIQIESNLTNTDELNEGTTNLYFTNTRARQAISVSDSGGDGSLSYNNSTGIITYTGPSSSEVRSHFSGGTGVTISSGQIAIGQDVSTTSAVQFSSVSLDGVGNVDTAVLTTSATTANQVVDSFSAATYRSARYQIQIASGSDYQSIELSVIHNGTTATYTIFADIKTGASDLASFTMDVNSGNVRLLTTPANAATIYRVVRTTIIA